MSYLIRKSMSSNLNFDLIFVVEQEFLPIFHNNLSPNNNFKLIEISVKDDGRIEATYGLDSTRLIGKIELADFVNEHGDEIARNSEHFVF